MLPVVFLHGIRVSGSMWEPVISLMGRERAVAAPDLPGHGAQRGRRFTMAAAEEAVVDAVTALGGRALVVGMSLGGYVGIHVAARHPALVAGLVAMGCTARPERAAGHRLAARLAALDPERAARISAFTFRRALPERAAAAMVAGGVACEVMPEAVEAVAGTDPIASLKAYPGPVWLVNGARDPLRIDERHFLRACQDGRLVILPRRGHISMLADPHALARLVNDAAAGRPLA
jgi:pimeloyl-ACP methyl ester carboxylesterase